MTQENKELLLKGLCTGLPYRVVIKAASSHYSINGILTEIHCGSGGYYIRLSNGMQYRIEYIKPYLFPLSSMTEEQKQELTNLVEETVFQIIHSEDGNPQPQIAVDWYNKNHFDYRGLIPMDLAIDATGKQIY